MKTLTVINNFTVINQIVTKFFYVVLNHLQKSHKLCEK